MNKYIIIFFFGLSYNHAVLITTSHYLKQKNTNNFITEETQCDTHPFHFLEQGTTLTDGQSSLA